MIATIPGKPPLYFGVENLGTLIMGRGISSITGTATGPVTSLVYGIYNEVGSTISMDGNKNSITGRATGDGNGFPGIFSIAGIYNRSGTIAIGNGNNNSITGIGTATASVAVDEGTGFLASGIFNRQGGTIAIGNGNNNSITGVGGYYNGIYNRGSIAIGDGNNNSITGTGVSDGAYGIYNQALPPQAAPPNGSTASIIAGKGFGRGNFDGGNGRDTLELTKGNYKVSLGSGIQVNFKNILTGVTMNTFEFETLIAGNRKYDFSGLSNGQTITVA